MHELSIATSLVDALLDLAQKNDAQSKVMEVHLKIGELRAISIEQLKFSYKILSKDPFLNGSRLIVEEIPAIVHCQKCGLKENFQLDDLCHFELPAFRCPRCKEEALKIEGGNEIVIAKVRMRGKLPTSSGK